MHENHVAHLDIKLENVVLDAEGKVKVIDFGLSARTSDVYERNVEGLRGTPWYMAPEVLDKDQHPYAGGKANVWALGCLIYGLCRGMFPYFTLSVRKLRAKEQMNHYL